MVIAVEIAAYVFFVLAEMVTCRSLAFGVGELSYVDTYYHYMWEASWELFWIDFDYVDFKLDKFDLAFSFFVAYPIRNCYFGWCYYLDLACVFYFIMMRVPPPPFSPGWGLFFSWARFVWKLLLSWLRTVTLRSLRSQDSVARNRDGLRSSAIALS